MGKYRLKSKQKGSVITLMEVDTECQAWYIQADDRNAALQVLKAMSDEIRCLRNIYLNGDDVTEEVCPLLMTIGDASLPEEEFSEIYGMERVAMVLANTVQLQDWDGRYSRRNKEWAKTIPNDNPETVRCGYALNSHPAVLDGFIDLVRVEQQRSRTQGEKLQPSRPSVRDKLKQELPAHKPAAPKKREPER